ncbi:MAG TPA: hypothetical protein VK644_15005 [Chitinophagaceae bacterium]|nr:hypothetical protein [Chitinophagaceae bacterium]
MLSPFSPLELQFLRSSLSTRTDEELADLMERPLQDITDIINELTAGEADSRTADVRSAREEKEKRRLEKLQALAKERADRKEERLQHKREQRPPKAAKVKAAKPIKPKKEKVNRDPGGLKARQAERDRERQKSRNLDERRQAEKRQSESRGKLRTRVVDYSQMRSVKVDNGTYIYVKKGEDPAAAIQLYKANNSNNILREKIRSHNF